MHAAALDSPRLQSVLSALRFAGRAGLTTREVIDRAGVCAVNSAVAELRAGGVQVLCAYESTTASGARVYRYTLMESGL